MSLDIRIDADEVTKALDKLDGPESKKALKAAVRKAGQFLKPKVKAAAPVGPTGNLRRKVGARVKQTRQRDGFYSVVTSFARHRHLVIQGTQDRYTSSGAFRGRMTPNPFVDRVADTWEDAAVRVAEQELAAQLDLE